MSNMFETLLELPLFQGASKDSIAQLVEKIPFHFLKFNNGEKVLSAGDECTHIRFVISGSIKIVIDSQVSRISVSQLVDAPDVIAPSYLFGRHTSYPHDVYANGPCGILQIRKNDYMEILQSNKIFMLNILNYLSRNSQLRLQSLLNQGNGMIGQRLATTILSLTSASSYDIVVKFKQKDLCSLLGARRTSVINALNELKSLNIIDYTLTEIKVIDRRELLNYANQQ